MIVKAFICIMNGLRCRKKVHIRMVFIIFILHLQILYVTSSSYAHHKVCMYENYLTILDSKKKEKKCVLLSLLMIKAFFVIHDLFMSIFYIFYVALYVCKPFFFLPPQVICYPSKYYVK